MGAKGRLFVSTGILLTIGGCATTQEPAKLVDIRPAALGADPDAKPSDPLYLAAVSAIERRDYALALDALQAARARSPDDPRVWNAMGVVYDKLGRFDLSARYYAQAQELDPGSRIVSQNLAYSSVLQQKKAAETRALAAAAPQVAPPAVAVANPIAPAKVAEREAPPPPVVSKVTGPAPASRSVAQVADSERATRLAATGPVARWIAPVLEAFEPRPAAPAAAPVVPPAPVAVAQSAPAVARPAVPPEAPVAVARVTRPAVAAQTIPRAPAAPDHALRLADVTGPLSRLAAPILDALAPEPATAARPAEPAARAAQVRTVVLSATPHPAVAPAPAPAARVAAAAPAQPVTRAAPQRSIVIATRTTTAPIRVATPTGRVTLARNTVAAGSLLGRPLMVVNASGRRGGAEPVRMKLASRGWTAPVSVVRPGSLRSTSTIRYASRNVVVAKALARTLPYGVRLVSCGTTCKGVTLFVGADALRWKGGAARTRTPIQYRGRA